MKFLNIKKYKIYNIFNNLNLSKLVHINFKIYQVFKKHNFNKALDGLYNNAYKIIQSSYNSTYKVIKNFSYKNLNFPKISLKTDIRKYKSYQIHILGFFIFFMASYLVLPFFFNYNKEQIENTVCKELKIKCKIEGKITYSFLPSPRIKIENLVIEDFAKKNTILAQIKKTELKISIFNLYSKEKIKYKKIIFKDPVLNIKLGYFQKYKDYYLGEFKLLPIVINKGIINFTEKKNIIMSIKKLNFKYKPKKNKSKTILKGEVFNDKILITIKSIKKENEPLQIFVVKLANHDLYTKIKLFDNKSDLKNSNSGNALIKKGKNKLTADFDYKNNKIVIKNSNLRNSFLDGKLDGEIKFSPFFDFNLNLNLNSTNFNQLFKKLVSLKDEDRKKLFKINKKLNGKINLSINKIFSKHTFIRSLESEMKFVNGNIILDRALLNLGKVGATDINGVIKNGKSFSNFKFESNIYIDNLKYFYSKFNIYNKPKEPYSLFVGGNLDLKNLNLRLTEITDNNKFKESDVSYIEKEFNNLFFENNYKSLFDYDSLKNFVKSMNDENN